MWASVLIQAIYDLDNQKVIRARNQEGRYLRNKDGEFILTSVGEEAFRFLKGEIGDLQYVCDSLGYDTGRIISTARQLGPAGLKQLISRLRASFQEVDHEQI